MGSNMRWKIVVEGERGDFLGLCSKQCRCPAKMGSILVLPADEACVQRYRGDSGWCRPGIEGSVVGRLSSFFGGRFFWNTDADKETL